MYGRTDGGEYGVEQHGVSGEGKFEAWVRVDRVFFPAGGKKNQKTGDEEKKTSHCVNFGTKIAILIYFGVIITIFAAK